MESVLGSNGALGSSSLILQSVGLILQHPQWALSESTWLQPRGSESSVIPLFLILVARSE